VPVFAGTKDSSYYVESGRAKHKSHDESVAIGDYNKTIALLLFLFKSAPGSGTIFTRTHCMPALRFEK
jgi:hypothetical protein